MTLADRGSVKEGGRVAPGAFADTIARWQASGKSLPLHWNTRPPADSVIGSIDPAEMRETDEGLYVLGQLDLEDSALAREAWRSIKRNRIGLSIGYVTKRSTRTPTARPCSTQSTCSKS